MPHLFKGTVWREIVKFYNKCDRVFTPTQEMKKQLEDKGARNVHLWSRGIRRDLFNPEKRSLELRKKWGAENKTIILFSGRFVKYKDLEIVKEVYQKMMKENRNDVLFVLLGSGPMEVELRKEMPRAVFPGYLHGNDLHEAYASGDIFLFPSTTETFGNVVMEALSSGVPAIVSDEGGCKEIVKLSSAGIVCGAKDVDAFYRACIKLLTDEPLRSKYKDNGIRWCSERSWDEVNTSLLKDFQYLIDMKREGETP